MTWLSILKILLSLADGVLKLVNDQRLVNAGMRKAALEGIERTNAVIDDALKGARAGPDSDYVEQLRRKYSAGRLPAKKSD